MAALIDWQIILREIANTMDGRKVLNKNTNGYQNPGTYSLINLYNLGTDGMTLNLLWPTIHQQNRWKLKLSKI